MRRVDPTYWYYRMELKKMLDKPLAGGRGFQVDDDKVIHDLCKKISEYDLPPRT